MENMLTRVGFVIGFIGLVLCLVSGVSRVAGSFYLFGYQSITILFAGIAMMVAACMFKLYGGSFSR